MYDSWMLIAGILMAFLGVPGLITGRTVISMYMEGVRSRSGRPLDPDAYYAYYGRRLPVVMTLTAAFTLAMFFLSRQPNAIIPATIANVASAIACIVGGILALVLMETSGSPPRDLESAPSMSLSQAANYLKMPEDELLQLAQNGGIEARHMEGVYKFDKEILDAYREAMGGLR